MGISKEAEGLAKLVSLLDSVLDLAGVVLKASRVTGVGTDGRHSTLLFEPKKGGAKFSALLALGNDAECADNGKVVFAGWIGDEQSS